MRLEKIDKQRYSKHYKIVFGTIVVALIVISLGSSTLMISFFSDPEASNFWYNLGGVVIAGLVV